MLLALCVGNSPVTDEFPSQKPVMQSLNIFFDLRLHKRLSKQSRCRRFETPLCSLWCDCNVRSISLCYQVESNISIIHLRCKSPPPQKNPKKTTTLQRQLVLDNSFTFHFSLSFSDNISLWIWICVIPSDVYLFIYIFVFSSLHPSHIFHSWPCNKGFSQHCGM